MADRFIIRSQPRSGTHMLASMLQQHSMVWCLGEVFNPDDIKDKPYAHTFATLTVQQRLAYAWQMADGFVVHGFQRDLPRNERLMESILEGKPKVVWLLRRDKFLQAVSDSIANQRQHWQNLHCIPPTRFELDVGSMLKFIKPEMDYQVEDEKRLRPLDSIRIYYEDLVNNRNETLAEVFSFIGVSPIDVTPQTVPTRESGNLSDYVPNWEQVKVEFYQRYGECL